MSSAHRFFYSSLLSLGLLALNAQAGSREDDILNMSLEELMNIKVTSSTLTDENLQTVPASMTVFTRQQIQQMGINTLEELMNHVPGYQSYRSDDFGKSFSSRNRRTAAGNREALVLLDGQRLNHDLFGSLSSTERDVSLANVQRVEFLRGPGSAIYGANAFLGVINIITATNLNEADLSAGSFQQQQTNLNISAQWKNGLQTSLFAQGRKGDGEPQKLYDSFSTSLVDSRQSTRDSNVYWRAAWDISAQDTFSIQARHIDFKNANAFVAGSVGNGYNTQQSTNSFVAFRYQHNWDDQWEFSSRWSVSPYQYAPQYKARQVPLVILQGNVHGNDDGIENQLRWHRGSAKALLGLDLSRNSVDKVDLILWQPNTTSFTAPVNAFGTETRRVTALYGQWQDSLSAKTSYVLGLRHDSYSDVDGHTSPRLGLIWQANETNTLKWLYGEAFRAPARNEISAKNNNVQRGNPDLKPEISKTFDMIWLHTSTKHYSSIGLFDTEITNAVEYTNIPGPVAHSFANGASQHMNGLEVEWQWFFADGWQLHSDLSHIFNSPFSNNPDAEDLIGTSLIYSFNNLTFSMSGRYHGESHDINTSAQGYNALGGYTLFDAHAHYQFTPQWQVYGNVRNLTDKNYLQPAIQNTANTVGVPGTGREVEVGLRWNFD